MTAYLCVSFIAVGFLVVIGKVKAALIAALIAISGGFGFRLYLGEEVRGVVVDALLCGALLPIGWWATKQWQAADSN